MVTLTLTLTFFLSVAGGKSRPQIWQGRDVQVKVPMMGLRESRTVTVGTSSGGGGGGAIGVITTAAVVVPPLMATKSLTCRKAFKTNGTLVGPATTAANSRIRKSGRNHGGDVIILSGVGFAMTSFMTTKGLVGRKRLITNITIISQFQKRWRRRRGGRGI